MSYLMSSKERKGNKMRPYNFYAVYVNGKWKFYNAWTFYTGNNKPRFYDYIGLEAKTRYLAKKELAARIA